MQNQIESYVQSVLGKNYTVESYDGIFELNYRGRPITHWATELEAKTFADAIEIAKK